ncbi:hypothetical protein ACLMJK_004264 [Lecanora helva]
MFAFPLLLLFNLYSRYVLVRALPTTAETSLAQFRDPLSSLDLLNATQPLNDSTIDDHSYAYPIPYTNLEIHLKIPPKPLPIPMQEALSVLYSFIKQTQLHPPKAPFGQRRYVVFDGLEVTLSPVKSPISTFTFSDAGKTITGLWYFISRNRLLFESTFAVFSNGRMVAWGMLGKRFEGDSRHWEGSWGKAVE